MVSHQYEYLIALGSNIGDRLDLLNQAAQAIHISIGPVTNRSSIYETEPVGAADQLFLNAAVRVLSNMRPEPVMTVLLDIEKKLGRVRSEHWGNRTIDLDILLVQLDSSSERPTAVASDTVALTIPHPEMLNRDFVLIPAAQIAGQWIHPKTNSTLEEEAAGRFSGLKRYSRDWDLSGSRMYYGDRLSEVPAPTFI